MFAVSYPPWRPGEVARAGKDRTPGDSCPMARAWAASMPEMACAPLIVRAAKRQSGLGHTVELCASSVPGVRRQSDPTKRCAWPRHLPRRLRWPFKELETRCRISMACNWG